VRALLVVNPNATTTTAAGRDVLAHALASELKLDVLLTRYRGHAAEATAQAVRDGVELVVAHGGDGTVNEVANGMLQGTGGPVRTRPPAGGSPHPPARADPRQSTRGSPRLPTRGNDSPRATGSESGPARGNNSPECGPALAVVPGGSANVFARALGIPRDPVEATAEILRALTVRRSRLVGLGRADDRWFTFNAGMGWDADVVAEVERMRFRGLAATPLRYAATGLRQYYRQWREPKTMTVEVPGMLPPTEVRLALVSNTSTWTYLGSRSVHTNPGASFTSGLGLFALRRLGIGTVAPVLHEILRRGGDPRGRNVLRHDAVAVVKVSCEAPVALQLDGDHLGERSEVEFLSVPEALRVVV
jgi:diacylglycerol kinase family enzyme